MLKTWVRVGVAAFFCAWIVLLMNNCAATVNDNLTGAELHVVETAIAVWQDNGLPFGERCQQERETLIVEHVNTDLLEECRALEPTQEPLWGCYISSTQTIRVANVPEPARQDLIVHQTLHWLHECTWGVSDHIHSGLVPSSREGVDVISWYIDEPNNSLELQVLRAL